MNGPVDQNSIPRPSVQPRQPPEPVIVTSKPPINWLRVLILVLLGVIVLAGATYGAYWYSAKKSAGTTPSATPETPTVADETANWNTYKDQYLSFKYPLDYGIKETQIMGKIRVFPENEEELPVIGDLLYEMGIDYLDNPEGLTSKQWLDSWIEEQKPTNVTERKEINIGGATGDQATLHYGVTSTPDVFTFVGSDKKVLRVFFQKGSQDDPVMQKQEIIFNQILSTFKFLD